MHKRARAVAIGTACGILIVAGACKNDCDRAIDHFVHLAWQETVDGLTPEQRAQTAGVLPTEAQMRPKMVELATRNFGGRCGERAFTVCVLAAKTAAAAQACKYADEKP
jgi:hypothetical protein